ncbi:MAG TPA: hypothetical protein P5023_06900, partial [Bacteroidales bacterium]|nr:hypothetical protein [Bacteroidales bacterium]
TYNLNLNIDGVLLSGSLSAVQNGTISSLSTFPGVHNNIVYWSVSTSNPRTLTIYWTGFQNHWRNAGKTFYFYSEWVH